VKSSGVLQELLPRRTVSQNTQPNYGTESMLHQKWIEKDVDFLPYLAPSSPHTPLCRWTALRTLPF